MKWFKKKKSRSFDQDLSRSLPEQLHAPPIRGSRDLIDKLPATTLQRVFSFVCPHSQDETYENCEQSAVEDTCMLCDLRDLAHCAQVSRRWRELSANCLYHSIRIDAVHYCEREEILSERRKRRRRLNRNAEPEDTAQARLGLLCRTLRDDPGGFAWKVQFLKLPYMTRETSKADLARTVAVLPNLLYVDLPEGFFTDDPSCNTLKHEVQARCPNIRKMTYMGGSERSLELLASGTVWQNLEVLELSRMNMDPTILRRVLGSLPCLRALKVSNMQSFNNQLFQHNDYLAPFPPLSELLFENTPNITAEGLIAYLFRSDTQDSLKTLSLTTTGVHPSTVQQIVSTAPRLTFLSIIETVSTSFPAGVPPLASSSLQTLHFEIISASSTNAYASTTASYYAYLSSSLISNCLPALRQLYVRDPDFPETLIDLAPPSPAFASDPDNFSPHLSPNSAHSPFTPSSQSRFSSNNPFAPKKPSPGLKQELEVFSRGLDEMGWNFTAVQQPTGPRRKGSASALRPVSTYGLVENTERNWAQGGGARKSVIVGNGFGGFLAVPGDDFVRPKSSAGEREKQRSSQYDIWR